VNLFAATTALLGGILVWWLATRRLTARSWETQAAGDPAGDMESFGLPSPKVGLWILLAVMTSFFGLFIAAYALRMSPHPVKGVALGDWQPLPEPAILWWNTGALLLASVGLQVARSAVQLGQTAPLRAGWFAGGAFALLFLVGQLAACRELQLDGYYAAANPANAFFYTLTTLHGLHLLGGLAAWVLTTARLRRDSLAIGPARLGVEMCTTYWHFLLVVWLVLFSLLLAT
jgi:cytochrome c oxidase subunit 3